jgi:hypothetical protein
MGMSQISFLPVSPTTTRISVQPVAKKPSFSVRTAKPKSGGHYHMVGAISFLPEVAPPFCHNCGKPYPWMEDRLQTAKELLYHDDKLSLEEREKLWGLLRYVMSDPKSDLAPAKKKLFEIGIAKALPAT